MEGRYKVLKLVMDILPLADKKVFSMPLEVQAVTRPSATLRTSTSIPAVPVMS
jgi:hypothetical protein